MPEGRLIGASREDRFDFQSTPLPGLWIFQRKPIDDSRGFFCRFFCAEAFEEPGFAKPIAQINHTRTECKGAVRGLHFQRPPAAEVKAVSCLRGEVFDVAVDVRRGSPSFLHWYGAVLSAENQRSFLIPEGFAHGFQSLTESCEMLYLHSAPYRPDLEGALHAADPRIGIAWPLPIAGLSARDGSHPFVSPDFEGIAL